MRKLFTLAWLFALSLVTVEPLSAMSIGRVDEPFDQNNIIWQKVVYDDRTSGFKVCMPGAPKSGISNGNIYTASNYDGIDYEVHTGFSAWFNFG